MSDDTTKPRQKPGPKPKYGGTMRSRGIRLPESHWEWLGADRNSKIKALIDRAMKGGK